jgi:hypothetical protein
VSCGVTTLCVGFWCSLFSGRKVQVSRKPITCRIMWLPWGKGKGNNNYDCYCKTWYTFVRSCVVMRWFSKRNFVWSESCGRPGIGDLNRQVTEFIDLYNSLCYKLVLPSQSHVIAERGGGGGELTLFTLYDTHFVTSVVLLRFYTKFHFMCVCPSLLFILNNSAVR